MWTRIYNKQLNNKINSIIHKIKCVSSIFHISNYLKFINNQLIALTKYYHIFTQTLGWIKVKLRIALRHVVYCTLPSYLITSFNPFASSTSGLMSGLSDLLSQRIHCTNGLTLMSPQQGRTTDAVRQYNETLHSLREEKSEDVFFSRRGYPHIKQKFK